VPKLTLPSSIHDLLPEGERTAISPRRSLSLDGGSWPEVVAELRARFPELAARALTENGSVAQGFMLVVNDEVVASGEEPPALAPDDELFLLAAIAGG
jgi:hypothetical protein